MKKLKKTDYHDFTTIDTPKSERQKLNVGNIWINSVQCLKCNDIIRSVNKHDYVRCKCRLVAVDGGSWHMSRDGYPNFKELSIPYNDIHEEKPVQRTP